MVRDPLRFLYIRDFVPEYCFRIQLETRLLLLVP